MSTVQLTVGKVDAGVAILLTPEHHLLEFPALLLPADIETGSLVDISVSRNHDAERKADEEFQLLQDDIYNEFGNPTPVVPVLSIVDITMTHIHMAWDNGLTYDPTNLHIVVNNAIVHTIPLNPTLPFTSIPIQGDYIFDNSTPGAKCHILLRFTSDSGAIFESNTVEASTVGPYVDPSSIPLPDSPKLKSYPLALSSPESIAADLENELHTSLESLDLSDSPALEGPNARRPLQASENASGSTKFTPDSDQT